MRDFDQERKERHEERERLLGDRSFQIGGEVFSYHANVSVDLLQRLTSDTPLLGNEYIEAIKASCLEMIEDEGDSHERFLGLLKRKKDPITLQDLQTVFQGLVEEAFKRPTQASLPSGDGDAETGASSTESPSTEQEPAAAA